jgi:chromosome segregation ATPase
MDIEQVQKTTKLAQELLKYGLSSDMEEATGLADTLVNKKMEITSIRNQLDGKLEEKPEEKKEEASKSEEKPVQVSPETSKHIQDLQMAMKKAMHHISEQNKATSELRARIGNLTMEVQKLKATPSPPRPTPVMQKRQAQPQTQLNPEEPKENPRSGNWESSDVSIEKIFYAGPKDE